MATAIGIRLLLAALAIASRPASAVDVALGRVLENARARAEAKLASPVCRLVLGDFHDAAGRTLEAKLAETGLSPAEFLGRLELRSGRYEDPCHRGRVEAFTFVGVSTIWVCPSGSLSLGSGDVNAGSNVLIHEMLHALGLAENPPTAIEIGERVKARCGP
jgi:hypothetical protein